MSVANTNCQRTIILLRVNQRVLKNVINNRIIIVDDFSAFVWIRFSVLLLLFWHIYVCILIIGTFGNVSVFLSSVKLPLKSKNCLQPIRKNLSKVFVTIFEEWQILSSISIPYFTTRGVMWNPPVVYLPFVYLETFGKVRVFVTFIFIFSERLVLLWY